MLPNYTVFDIFNKCNCKYRVSQQSFRREVLVKISNLREIKAHII